MSATSAQPPVEATPGAPPRPSGVPAEAAWNPNTGEWELSALDGEGRRDGLSSTWRADGTLAAETAYRAGERDGVWRRFHEDGSVAREGRYHEGRPDGLMRAVSCEAPSTELLQTCCVPPNAWRLEHDYDDGRLAEIRWFDRAGVHLLPSGAPHPIRPASVPREARFEEGRDQWTVSSYADGAQADGVWLRWARDGVLRERDEYRLGKPHGLWQRFDAAGGLGEESEWRDGGRTGAHRRVVGGAAVYTDARVHEERGSFDHDQAVGPWTLHDASGDVVAKRDLGAALDEASLLASPALLLPLPASGETGGVRGSARWESVSDELAASGRPVEALLAAARATASARDATPLRARLAQLALPRTPDGAVALANELTARADMPLVRLANGLVAGGDAASLLRALAAAISGREAAALDLVDAALLLAPERAAAHVTRALINVHLGRPDEVRADVAALPDDLAEQRTFIERYAHVIFGAFPFLPTHTVIETRFPDVPEAPEQPLDAVVTTVQKLATRLGLVRAAILARLPVDVVNAAPSWLPPDLSALLPDGPAPLASWEFEEVIEDDAADGEAATPADPPEPVLVTVDEALAIEPEASLPTLLRLARREWAAVCWLCWSVGLDRVALPTEIRPPADFGVAAGMTIERLWRCRDKLITGGLRALTQGIPGFVWEGVEIDLLPAVLAEIAAEEHLEMRAIFYWLCDAGVQSPWQDNLRTPD
ncbi:MAG TPA: hypothetical protein VHJ20_14270 [Polyangia bacterium]|nr:hypothetical protein [Polyangia bacterium]